MGLSDPALETWMKSPSVTTNRGGGKGGTARHAGPSKMRREGRIPTTRPMMYKVDIMGRELQSQNRVDVDCESTAGPIYLKF